MALRRARMRLNIRIMAPLALGAAESSAARPHAEIFQRRGAVYGNEEVEMGDDITSATAAGVGPPCGGRPTERRPRSRPINSTPVITEATTVDTGGRGAQADVVPQLAAAHDQGAPRRSRVPEPRHAGAPHREPAGARLVRGARRALPLHTCRASSSRRWCRSTSGGAHARKSSAGASRPLPRTSRSAPLAVLLSMPDHWPTRGTRRSPLLDFPGTPSLARPEPAAGPSWSGCRCACLAGLSGGRRGCSPTRTWLSLAVLAAELRSCVTWVWRSCSG
jgi:hypothetical protein